MQTKSNNYAKPTFRAKGVVKEIVTIDKENKKLYVAAVQIGGEVYEVPVSRNVREGDVLVIKINVINL